MLVVLEILVGVVLLAGGAIFAFLSWWIGQSSSIYPMSQFVMPFAALSWSIFVVQILVFTL